MARDETSHERYVRRTNYNIQRYRETGQQLSAVMENYGYSQAKLAEATGAHFTAVSKWIAGVLPIADHYWIKLVKLMPDLMPVYMDYVKRYKQGSDKCALCEHSFCPNKKLF